MLFEFLIGARKGDEGNGGNCILLVGRGSFPAVLLERFEAKNKNSNL